MPYQLSDLSNQSGTVFRDLAEAVCIGIRDLDTGGDRVLLDLVDPRTSGGFSLDFALARALALAWRAPEDAGPVPVVVLAGTCACAMKVRELPLGSWEFLREIEVAADGVSMANAFGSLVRRLWVAGGDHLADVFGIEDSRQAPGHLALCIGTPAKDPVLKEALARAGVDLPSAQVGVILLLYAPNPGPRSIGDIGGPVRNQWRPQSTCIQHMSESHLTAAAQALLEAQLPDTWFDEDYRRGIEAELRTRLAERGEELTLERYLDVLAEGSPLRRLLPAHLSQHFPVADSVFRVRGTGNAYTAVPARIWDLASPSQRLELLAEDLGMGLPVESGAA